MSVSSRVGAALAAGYVLGRFKKLRLALVVGSALANKNVRDSAMSFISQGTKGLASSPEAQKIAKQITTELADAGKAAAMTAVSGRINQLSDQLSNRSASLLGEVKQSEQEQGEGEEPQEGGEAQSRDQKAPGKSKQAGKSEQGEESPQDEESQQDEESGEEPEGEYEDEGEESGEESDEESGGEHEDESDEYEGDEYEDEEGEATDEYEDEGESDEESGEESEDETGEASDEYEDEEGGEDESDRDEQAARAVPRRQRAASPAARKGA